MNELRALIKSGKNIYARRRNGKTGQIWNTDTEAFEDWDAGNVAKYSITMTDMSGDLYTGDLPDLDRILNIIQFYEWDGVAATVNDVLKGGGITDWKMGLRRGAIEFTYTLTDDNDDPVADAQVWVTTRGNADNILASGITNQDGEVVFWLDAGDIDVYRQKTGINFDNPDLETVS